MQPQPQPQPQQDPSLPPNWSCHRTPQGQSYFHNHVTGETTWTPPQPQPNGLKPTTNPPTSPTSALESAVPSEPTSTPVATTAAGPTPIAATTAVPTPTTATTAGPTPTPTAAYVAPTPAQYPSVPPSMSNHTVASPQMAASASYAAHQTALPYTMESLVAKSSVKGGAGKALMELERDKLLRLNIGTVGADSFAWIRRGCMIARRGDIKIRRQGMREQGFGRMMKKAVTGEGMTLIKCEGRGVVFCADQGKIISVVYLNNQTLYLNGNDCLALSASLKYDIKLMKGANIAAGGLFNIAVSGSGMVAFTCHGAVVTLRATPQDPVFTDPNATVAWTHQPTFKMDMSMKALVGRNTGEEFQLQFNDGYVIVQPFEEVTVGKVSGGGGGSAIGSAAVEGLGALF